MDIAETIEMVNRHMQLRYGVQLDQLEIAETPGYWMDKQPQIHYGHPLHSFLFCAGPFKATYTYFDHPRVNGRFASVTRSWKAIRNATLQSE